MTCLAQRCGTTLFSTLLTCWLMVMITNGWPADMIAIPWSERFLDRMCSQIGNHIRMLVLKGSTLHRSDTSNGSLICPFEEAVSKVDSAFTAAAEELFMCTASSAPQVGYNCVFAWEFEGGGWLEAATAASSNRNWLQIPQITHPGAISTLSLWYSSTGEIKGWLQSNDDQDQSPIATLIVQEFITTCRTHAERYQL